MKDDFSLSDFLSQFPKSEQEKIKAKVTLVSSIDSTNTFMMKESESFIPLLDENGKLTQKGKDFNLRLLAAETQTKGKGRLGRVFESPEKSGIYFTLAWVKESGITDPAMITVTACVAICRAIEKTYGIECAIKWVNDIYCNSKKVCGILVEGIINQQAGRIDGCICGIGINLKTGNSFDSELRNKAGGILDGMEPEKPVAGRSQFLACCYRELVSALEDNSTVIDEYRKHSMLYGKTVTVTPTIGDEKSSYVAVVKDINEKAELVVQLEDGTIKNLHSGEVSLHGTTV